MSPINNHICSLPQQEADVGKQPVIPLLISVSINNLRVLQRCYLPFFRHGGLFVPSPRAYGLRQRVFLILKLPAPAGSATAVITHAVTASVAWLTPAQAQGSPGMGSGAMGVGLHFDPGEPNLKHAIESLLNALV